MSLESLTNEVLYEIFQYLDIVEIFRSFYNLNHRFNTILFEYFHSYHLNFYSILKYQNDFLSQHYFSSIINKIISLHLSDNNNETPPQTDLLSYSGLSLQQFTQLRSLSVSYISCDTTMRQLMNDCQQLSYLTHLKVIKCHPGYMSSIDFATIIWSLSKLIHCHLDTRSDFPIPSIISSSLKYFSIICDCWGLKQVINLFQSTSNLQYVHIPLNKLNIKHHPKLLSNPLISTLILSNVHSLHGMINILRIVPNLIDLKVDTYYIDCNGYRWEQIITNHLLKLKHFSLRMRIEVPGKKNDEIYINKFLQTFHSQFWIEQQQWYVRCHGLSYDRHRTLLLYTLPYSFNDCSLNMLTMPYKTTYPYDNEYFLYNHVKNLYSISSIDCISLSKFIHIRNLSIELCFDKQLWKSVPIFYQLISVTLLKADADVQDHLQYLLDRSPNLYSLTIRSWPSIDVPIIKNINPSIRRIDLQIDNLSQNYSYFDTNACEQLLHSSLGCQCEELLIKVKNRESILLLVNGMYQLRILQIQYSLDLPFFLGYKECNEERNTFIQWLHDHLPEKCVVVPDHRYRMFDSFSKIWIRLNK